MADMFDLLKAGALIFGRDPARTFAMVDAMRQQKQEAQAKNALQERMQEAIGGFSPSTGINWDQGRPGMLPAALGGGGQGGPQAQQKPDSLGVMGGIADGLRPLPQGGGGLPGGMPLAVLQALVRANPIEGAKIAFPTPKEFDLAPGAARFREGPNGPVKIAEAPKEPKEPKLESIFDSQGREIKVFMQPDGSYKPVGSAKAEGAKDEPLVQVYDPTSPTGVKYVTRPQASGMPGPGAERRQRMQTYWDENGSQQTLDSNDPEDQKIIKAQGLTASSPTDTERTAKGFLDRMAEAQRRMEEISKTKGFNPADYAQTMKMKAPLGIGNYLVTPEFQAYRQAQEDWVRAKLRKESGAVIGKDEMDKEILTYFPQPGDKELTLAGKAASRRQAERQFATGAGLFGRKRLRELDTEDKPLADPLGIRGP